MKKRLPAIISFILLIITIPIFLYIYYKTDIIKEEGYWDTFEKLYEYKTKEEKKKIYLNAYILEKDILEDSISFLTIIYNEDIEENMGYEFSIPIEDISKDSDDLVKIQKGDNLEIGITKYIHKVEYSLKKQDTLARKGEYVWLLFNELRDSLSNYSKENIDPIFIIAGKKLLEENSLTEKQLSEVNQYLSDIGKYSYEIPNAVLPCYSAKYLNLPYIPEDIEEYNYEYINPAQIIDSKYDENIVASLPIENYMRVVADSYRDCGRRDIQKEYNLVLNHINSLENINLETIRWIAYLDKINNPNSTVTEEYFDLVDPLRYYNIQTNSIYRECILNDCNIENILNKLPIYIGAYIDESGNRELHIRESNVEIDLALTLIAILENE